MRASFFAAAAAAGVLAAALLVVCAPTASASAVFKKDADLYEGAVAPRDRPCQRFARRRAVVLRARAHSSRVDSRILPVHQCWVSAGMRRTRTSRRRSAN